MLLHASGDSGRGRSLEPETKKKKNGIAPNLKAFSTFFRGEGAEKGGGSQPPGRNHPNLW